ncbi:MAG: hypothetical protein IPP25_05340 [Saprospiraceae bacterium]|nr:hypothetical protein [Candidatus Opimibacter skivensis]
MDTNSHDYRINVSRNIYSDSGLMSKRMCPNLSATVQQEVSGDICSGAIDINGLFTNNIGIPVVSSPYNNIGASVTEDPSFDLACFFEMIHCNIRFGSPPAMATATVSEGTRQLLNIFRMVTPVQHYFKTIALIPFFWDV